MNSVSSVQTQPTVQRATADSAKNTAATQASETQPDNNNAPRHLSDQDRVDVNIGPLETPDAGALWKQSSNVDTFSSPEELLGKLDTFLEENRSNIEDILAANGIADPEQAAGKLIDQIRASAQTQDQFDFDLNSYMLEYTKTSGSWSVEAGTAMQGAVGGKVIAETAVTNIGMLGIHFDKNSGEASFSHQDLQMGHEPKTTAIATSGKYADAIQIVAGAAARAHKGDTATPPLDAANKPPALYDEQPDPAEYIAFDVETDTRQANRLSFQTDNKQISSLLSELLGPTSADADKAYGNLEEFIRNNMNPHLAQFSKAQLAGAVAVTKLPEFSNYPGSNVNIST